MSKKDILLIGGGGHCKSVIDVIEVENKFNIVGIIDKIDKVGENVLDYQIIGSDEDIPKLKKVVNFAFISAGQIRDYSFRSNMFIKLKELNFNIPVIISPISYVSKYSTVTCHAAAFYGSRYRRAGNLRRARREAGTTHATLSDPRLTKGRFRCHSTHSPCSMTAPAPSVRARWR